MKSITKTKIFKRKTIILGILVGIWILMSLIVSISINKEFKKMNFYYMKYDLLENYSCYLEISNNIINIFDDYFIVFSDDEYFIAKLKKDEINNIINSSNYSINGYSKKIDNKILLETENIFKSNKDLFEDSFDIGTIYIDQTQKFNYYYLVIIVVFPIVILFSLHLINMKSNKRLK